MTDASLTFFVIADGQRRKIPFMNTSWADWQNPVLNEILVEGGTLTIGAHIVCGARSWGTLDDFSVTLKSSR